jgi:UDP-N-acetylglucosamine 2-epimerase (non-hydrolysing)
MVVFGTRPEAIKVAPIVKALESSPRFDPVVVVTAQHRKLLDDVLATFSITPDFDLDIIEDRQSLAEVTSRALAGLSPIMESVRPDVALVQGDTSTTFAGGLTAFYHRVPVVHVEAGLRSHDAQAPFPEEANRRLTAQVTDLHLAPTRSSKLNLLNEGVVPARVVVTGNTVIDALLHAGTLDRGYGDPRLEALDRDPRRVLLVTAHRRESWGTHLNEIGCAIADIARAEPDLLVVLPIHRNPIVRENLLPVVRGLPNVLVVEPLGYVSFVRLMRRANLILTDSGGVQEEAPSLGTPVLVMRTVTERVEAVAAGAVKLVGTSRAEIVRSVRALLRDRGRYDRMRAAGHVYGDGRAAQRCVASIAHLVGAGPPADEFVEAGAGRRDPDLRTRSESPSDLLVPPSETSR